MVVPSYRALRHTSLKALAILGVACGGALFVGLVSSILVKGIGALNWAFLFSPSTGLSGGGIRDQLIGTAALVLGAGVMSLPVAVGAAAFYVFYLHRRWARPVAIILYALNGVPTIVFGLFGYLIFGLHFGLGTSLLTGILVLATMILPTMTIAVLESFQSLSEDLFEAAESLGFSTWQCIRFVGIPSRLFGILTGYLLGLMRATGETAAILFTATAFSGIGLPVSIFDPVQTLQTHIFVLAQEGWDPTAAKAVWGASAVLMMVIAMLNLVVLYLRRYRNTEAVI